MDYDSYAIWWVPRPGTALGQFGAEWTGWCADRGVISSDPASAGDGPATARWLALRGLHASLGAPFRLAPGRSCWALEDALAELGERNEPILLPALKLTFFDGCVALALARPERAVAALAAAVAEAVGPFALPLPRPAPGGEPDAGGVGDPACPTTSPDRLHLPLTDRLDPGHAYAVAVELEGRLAPVLTRRQRIADLALVGDPGGGRPWRLLQRHPLSGEPARRDARVPDGMAWRGPSLLAPLAGARGFTTG